MTSTEQSVMTSGHGPERVVCSIEDLIKRVRSLASSDKRVLLGIVGAPGAGKSTVTSVLAEDLGEHSAVVGMDGFHLANQLLVTHGTQNRKGAPETFDSWGYVNLLGRLKADIEPVVCAPVFDRSLEEPIAGAVAVSQGPKLIISEGNYLLLEDNGWGRCRDLFDIIWYLDVDDDERQKRLIRRHMAYGKQRDDAVTWAQGSDQANADVVAVTKSRADLIIELASSSS